MAERKKKMGKELKGHYRGGVISASPTFHDELVVKFLSSIAVNKDFWSSVEVYSETELGRVDVVIVDKGGVYVLVEVKTAPEQVDEAIGQILRYKVLFSQRYVIDKDKINLGIACPSFYPSHEKVCEELGIKTWQV